MRCGFLTSGRKAVGLLRAEGEAVSMSKQSEELGFYAAELTV